MNRRETKQENLCKEMSTHQQVLLMCTVSNDHAQINTTYDNIITTQHPRQLIFTAMKCAASHPGKYLACAQQEIN